MRSLNARDKNHRTPIHHAAAYGHANATALLVEAKANIEVEAYNKTPLFLAVTFGHVAAAKELLRLGARRPNAWFTEDFQHRVEDYRKNRPASRMRSQAELDLEARGLE